MPINAKNNVTDKVLRCPFSLSIYNLKPRGIEVPNAIVGLALVYGGGTQWIAGVFEFVCGNTFGAVAFMTFGSFWLSKSSLPVDAVVTGTDIHLLFRLLCPSDSMVWCRASLHDRERSPRPIVQSSSRHLPLGMVYRRLHHHPRIVQV